ncbi:PTS sugar transporter subunit IIA [Altericroceibacterium spongiae]|uniref:PTS sugar transporter subunit IIA n=1 Tax=Altericroceibacterium spongiae TaxID=2320269 RepID=A0A420EED2_9SPHN|nr:PTS sugar transporter subunit IIA [Altericroceibacterium spongiae]RKF19043.1 PTS sugar transporter subunit IIA [Altericroceibacterium spongiae]
MTALFSLKPNAVECLRADSKQAILEALADRFAASYGLNAVDVLERLEERENLGSTGFGRNVAIPHARIEGLQRPTVAMLRLEEPVDFGSSDGLPVDIVFGLLSPENSGVSHLHALAAISRMVRDEKMHEALCEAPNAEAIYALLTNVIDRDAA